MRDSLGIDPDFKFPEPGTPIAVRIETPARAVDARPRFPLTHCRILGKSQTNSQIGWERLGSVLLEMYAHFYPERAAAQRLQRRLGYYGADRPPWRAA